MIIQEKVKSASKQK